MMHLTWNVNSLQIYNASVYKVNTVSKMLTHQNTTESLIILYATFWNTIKMLVCVYIVIAFPRIIPAEIPRLYCLFTMSVSLISRQPMKLQISFGFARAMPTPNPRTGMLWERDCCWHWCACTDTVQIYKFTMKPWIFETLSIENYIWHIRQPPMGLAQSRPLHSITHLTI